MPPGRSISVGAGANSCTNAKRIGKPQDGETLPAIAGLLT